MVDYETFKRAAIRNQDVIRQCPYDSSHLINQSRMQYHLVKCAKQHLQKELDTCPFNTTHRIARPELHCHVAECPDRRVFEDHKFQFQDEVLDNFKFPEYQTPSLPLSEENWDNEEQSTYEPEKYLTNKCVLRNIQGASKSERKKFRLEERMRVAHLSSGDTEIEAPQTDVPLRLPKSLPKAMKALELDSRLGMGRGVLCNAFREKNISEGLGIGRGNGLRSPSYYSLIDLTEVRPPVVGRGRDIIVDDNQTKIAIRGMGRGHCTTTHDQDVCFNTL